MKKFIFTLLCGFGVCCLGAFGDNALRVGDTQRLEFSAVQNAYDDYSAIFRAFDKNSTILQSYEKLARIHAIVDENNLNDPNDTDGCACQGLKPKIEPYKGFHHQGNKYIWQGKKLIIERDCWGGGEYHFELEEVAGGVKITTKFSRD